MVPSRRSPACALLAAVLAALLASPAAAAPARPSGSQAEPPTALFDVSFGGSGIESVVDVETDGAGNIYVLGATSSPDFPILNAAQARLAGCQPPDTGPCADAFVVSLTPDGGTLRYSTYLGGTGQEEPTALAVSPDGAVFVAGSTSSPDFPLADAPEGAPRGESDAFLAVLSPDGQLAAARYLGGGGRDRATGVALGPDGSVAVVGYTLSPDFPTAAPLQSVPLGPGEEAFVARVSPNLGRLLFSTYLGGSASDVANAVGVGPEGAIYVAGSTGSADFPLHEPIVPGLVEGAASAAFVAGLSPDGGALTFSTYLGGARTAEGGSALALSPAGDLLVGISVYQSGRVARLTNGGHTLAYDTSTGPPDGVAFDAEGHSFVLITPWPHKAHFLLPPGAATPCELGYPEVVELDADGRVLAAALLPHLVDAFTLGPGKRIVLVGSVGAGAQRRFGPPPPADPTAAERDHDVYVLSLRAGHGRMAWQWPPAPYASPGGAEFQAVWARTDAPAAEGRPVSGAPWRWGPEPLTGSFCEQYGENGLMYRFVQYYDKGRLEMNYPDRAPFRGWVTAGRLAAELIGGQVQLGETTMESRPPSDEAVAGDPAAVNPSAPTYRDMGVVAWPVNATRAARAGGDLVTSRLAAGGGVSDNPALARYDVRLGAYDTRLGHNIAAVFTPLALGGADDPAAPGLPLSEPYWVRARVGGVERDVLVQPFERTLLTYTPDNPPGWRVEQGNVGRHYLAWRYGPRL